jgi:hypothetical protein
VLPFSPDGRGTLLIAPFGMVGGVQGYANKDK